jgi:plastocyanin
MRRLRLFCAVVVVAIIPSRAFADAARITIENFTFDPAVLTVKPGTIVTWANADDIPHSIVEDNGAFHSKPLDTGDEFSMTFSSPGETDYFCGFHAHMRGKIIVKR